MERGWDQSDLHSGVERGWGGSCQPLGLPSSVERGWDQSDLHSGMERGWGESCQPLGLPLGGWNGSGQPLGLERGWDGSGQHSGVERGWDQSDLHSGMERGWGESCQPLGVPSGVESGLNLPSEVERGAGWAARGDVLSGVESGWVSSGAESGYVVETVSGSSGAGQNHNSHIIHQPCKSWKYVMRDHSFSGAESGYVMDEDAGLCTGKRKKRTLHKSIKKHKYETSTSRTGVYK